VIVTAPLPPTTLPAVQVTATRIGGGSVLCRGDGCAGILVSMQLEANLENLTQDMPLLDDAPVSGPQFCSSLKAQRPPGCSSINPPSSPGINVPGRPAYQPNKCGTGRFANWFLDFVLGVTSSQSYSDNLNAPFAGVDFTGACNSHDQCWASGGARATCDIQFRDSMISGCQQLGDFSASATCQGFAGSYHGAVSHTNPSNSAYAVSTQERICVVWANDMRENSCGN